MYYTLQHVQRICKDLSAMIYHTPRTVSPVFYRSGTFMTPTEADTGTWLSFGSDDRWGTYDGHAWFRAQVTIPPEYAGKKVVLNVSVDQENWFADSRQFILFLDGAMRQGMDINHQRSVITHSAESGSTFRIDLHAYAGLVEKKTELCLQLMLEDEAVKRLYYDINVPCQVAAELEEGDKTRLDILRVLNETVNLLDLRKPHSALFYQSVGKAQEYVETVFYQAMCGRQPIMATSTGHTHIDVAWLWTLAQTREKVARSFSTVLRLMEEYPDYVFMSSQPQLYQFLKQDYPDVYEKVRARVAEGRWEAEGGMWVEADCNLSSGEAFIRQLMHGKRFFREEFGVENRLLWLPDVFGYSAALPQILKKSGIDYFMTTKINWNQYNPIPADTFNWCGIDGSSVLTHFITTSSNDSFNPSPHFSTYNGYLAPRPVMGGWKRYMDKQIHEDILVAYGYGDGGGGTTEEMLENGMRMARGIPGCPRVVMSGSLPYFERMEKTVGDSPWLKKWVGELYFEYHRGTYTSMARNKRYNRKSELLYHDAETLGAMSCLLASAAYPLNELRAGWETILLNQFHDILPGSSIEPVYEVSRQQYEKVLGDGRRLVEQSLRRLNHCIHTQDPAVVVYNTVGFSRSDLVRLPWPETSPMPILADKRDKLDLRTLPVQRDGNMIFFVSPPVPSKGYTTLFLQDREAPATEAGTSLRITETQLENRYWLIELDVQGHFSRLYDKAEKREVLAPGQKGNVLRAFEDKPMANQNWDIDIYYQQKSWTLDEVSSIEVMERGPVRAGLRITRPFQDSTVVQTLYIYDKLPRIDFDTQVDWKADEVLLKVEFPVDIHANEATYDIQFGNLTRPTHWNTSWDWARFEVCAHKWADLSEDGYGVSLMNDCKYGYDIRDNVMRLTLIKSGMSPNPHADREMHRFLYSLYPHAGSWRESGTVEQAYSLNLPLYASILKTPQAGTLPETYCLFRIDAGNVVLETVKQAEDGDGMIVRLYECHNRRGLVKLHCGFAAASVQACDLMELSVKDDSLRQEADNELSFMISPYEIKTFRVRPR